MQSRNWATDAGLYIAIEGLEGAGKSTAIQYVSDYLSEKDIPYIIVREPGSTEISEAIRTILKSSHHEAMAPNTELLLMYAARVQLIEEIIKPALLEGQCVISDRSELSTLAYQGYGRGISLDDIHALSKLALHGFQPNYTVFLDIPYALGLERAKQRNPERDRFELESSNFFERIYKGYQILIQDIAGLFKVDGTGSQAVVECEIRHILDEILI
jgi:dTMP kinase